MTTLDEALDAFQSDMTERTAVPLRSTVKQYFDDGMIDKASYDEYMQLCTREQSRTMLYVNRVCWSLIALWALWLLLYYTGLVGYLTWPDIANDVHWAR